MRLIVIGVIAVSLAGCSSVTDVVKALSKDKASACAQIQTPWGSGLVGRSNSENDKVVIEGGRCTIERAK